MYKNPRLKHVEKIRDVIADMPIYWEGYTDLIIDQCNLLLETKKRKKCTCYYAGTISTPPIRVDNTNCPKHGKRVDTSILGTAKDLLQNQKEEFKPSPQPNKCDLHRTLDCPYCFAPQPKIEKLKGFRTMDGVYALTDEVEKTINALVDQVNKLTKTK